MREYIAIDVETTGLSPAKERMIELAAVRFRDGKEVDSFTTLINPERSLPERIVELTGIQEEMLADAPKEEIALSAFLEYTGDSILLGHNLPFDYSFIKTACSRRKKNYERQGIDTLAIAKKYLKELPSRTLEALCTYYQIDSGTSHRALDDARSAALLYERFRELFGEAKEAPLYYQVKKTEPMTTSQKNYLNDLIKYHKIGCDVSLEGIPLQRVSKGEVTKSEASRIIDRIIRDYGRSAGRSQG